MANLYSTVGGNDAGYAPPPILGHTTATFASTDTAYHDTCCDTQDGRRGT